MTFHAPWWLLLVVPVLALAVAYLLTHRRRTRYAVRFATLPLLEKVAPRDPGWRRHAPAAALLLALLTLAFAAGRPELMVRVPHERATVIVAIDVSQSMQATDVSPNRLDAAREAASTFIQNLPEAFNVGVVTFSGTTSVLAAPTTDHDDVVARLQNLTLGDSTAIGEAVFTSIHQVATMAQGEDSADVPARIVLLSDGTNTRGRAPEAAATAAAEARVPVSTIAYGTADGTIENQGRTIPVPVDEESLAALAEATGGQAYTAASGDELAAVYDDIGSSIGWRTEAREITPYLAALALLLALGAGAMSLRWFARLP
jgi:Ca-activated chloride channel family protein